MSFTLGRRSMLRTGVAGSLAIAGCSAPKAAPANPRFPHGVASFDPRATSVILWARIELAAPSETVTLVVARDETMIDEVVRTTIVANADNDGVMITRVDSLEPGTDYFYELVIGSDRSTVGHTRTLPALETETAHVAFVTCASYAHGFFHVYARIADRSEIDLVVHLGDYIYEVANGVYGSRRAYDPPHELITEDDYRRRYAHYRSDRDLARLHATHPMLAMSDDHEIANNAHRGGSIVHDPAIDGDWSSRVAAAQRAHRDWVPSDEQIEGSQYRTFELGNLATLFVLETRMEGRDPPPVDDEEADDAGRTMLGVAQRERLLADLGAASSRWKIITTSVQLSPHREQWNDDAWDGYSDERRIILEAIRDQAIEGVIFMCGDGHKTYVDEVAIDPFDRDVYDPATGRGAIAVELMTPAVNSPNLFGDDARTFEADTLHGSPHTQLVDAEHRGYWTLAITRDLVHADLYFVADVENEEGGSERLAASFEVAYGNPRWVRIS